MPASITQGARTVSFQHDDKHQRIKQVSTDGATLYIKAFGVTAELFGIGTPAARWNDYLSVGNVQVGMRVTDIAAQTVSTRYFHTDHLGSVTVITNESAVVVERLSFDAWGKRRYPNGTDDPTGVISSQTNRGFAGHEELDAVALVHMNGRVYDPPVGRMISADPTVPDPMNAQAWNRYSCVGNDPLAFTDPSGYSWLSSFFRSVANFFTNNPTVRSIVQIAITVVLTAAIAIPVIGPVIAAAGASIVTGLSGGNLGQMLRAGAIAGATAFAFNIVGGATNAVAGYDPSAAQPPKPVARSAVIDLFQAALRANNAAIVNSRGIYRIVTADQAIVGASINTDDSPDPEQVGSGLQVVQLKYVAASEIRRVLESIAPRGGIVRTDDARNLITLSGNRQDIASMMEAT